ncbi:hypothetical protein [Nonomuraea longicatena]
MTPPRWVLFLGIALFALIVMAVGAMIVSSGEHAPTMHASAQGSP